VAFASSLDQVGPMARTAEDAALLLEVLAGHDPRDSTSVNRPVPSYRQTCRQPLAGLRLGLVREHFGPGLDAEVERAVRAAVQVFESQGASVTWLSLPHSRYAVATYYIIAPCEASSNLARYDGMHYGFRTSLKPRPGEGDNALIHTFRQTRAEGFGAEVKRRIMLGTYALSAGYYDAYYLKALKVRRLIRQDFDRALAEVDLIAGPVTPTPAFPLDERADDPLAMYLFDLYTVSTNLAGIAAISIPCGFSSAGLPIGLHLQGPTFAEERLLRAACMFQQATDWHARRPKLD
jgi:aspartyl-tRNA(Asn)/glutamyl-tRNA(Gln) amidotransferase subunit A